MLWLERFSLFGLSIKCKWDGFLEHTILHVCILEKVFAVRFLLLTQGSATGRRKWWSEKHCHTAEIPNGEIRWGNKTPESLSNFTAVYVRASSYGAWPSFLNFPSLNKIIDGIGTLVTLRGRNALRHKAVYEQPCLRAHSVKLRVTPALTSLFWSPRLFQERQRMSDRLEDTSLRLKDEMDLYKRMMDKLRQNRLEFNKEREATQEVSVKGDLRAGSHVSPAWKPRWEGMGRQDEHWEHHIQWSCCWIVFLFEGCPQNNECARILKWQSMTQRVYSSLRTVCPNVS